MSTPEGYAPIETVDVLALVAGERQLQDEKWGPDRDLDSGTWTRILGEEFGEVCNATFSDGIGDLEGELIQVAAVAVAWVEALRRERS